MMSVDETLLCSFQVSAATAGRHSAPGPDPSRPLPADPQTRREEEDVLLRRFGTGTARDPAPQVEAEEGRRNRITGLHRPASLPSLTHNNSRLGFLPSPPPRHPYDRLLDRLHPRPSLAEPFSLVRVAFTEVRRRTLTVFPPPSLPVSFGCLLCSTFPSFLDWRQRPGLARNQKNQIGDCSRVAREWGRGFVERRRRSLYFELLCFTLGLTWQRDGLRREITSGFWTYQGEAGSDDQARGHHLPNGVARADARPVETNPGLP